MKAEPAITVGRLARMEIGASPGSGTRVVIQLRASHASSALRTVTLSGVTSLRISQEISDWPMTIQVVDISDRGWEGIRYAVTETEHGILSCWCEDATLTDG